MANSEPCGDQPVPVWRSILGSFRVHLAIVASVGLAVRVWSLLAWQQFQPVQGDQIYYHFGAKALAAGAGYVNPYAWNTDGSEIASALHPPGYTTYLAFWSLLGFDTPNEHKAASILLGVALVVAAGLLGRRLAPERLGHRAGIVAALFTALYPNLWLNDGGLAAESLYALLVMAMLLAAYRYRDQPTFATVAVLGAMIALAALTRAEALALFGLVALPLIATTRSLSGVRRVQMLAVCGLVGAAVMAPWVARNLLTFEEPSILSNGAGFVLEISNCDESYNGAHLGYWDVACDREETWLYPPQEAARHETEVERAKRTEGLTYAREHLAEVPQVVVARVGRMFDIFRPTQGIELNEFFERRGHTPSATGLLLYYGFVPLSVLAAWSMRNRRVTLIPVLALVVSAIVTAAMSFGITRYRVGLDTALAVLAGVGAVILHDRLRGRFWSQLSVIAVVALGVRVGNVLILRPLKPTCDPGDYDTCFAIGGDALYSHLQGELLSQGHGFASSFSYWAFGIIQPGAGDPPLYVVWLAWISGLHGSGGLGIQVLSLLIGLALVGGATWLARRRLTADAARLVAAVGLLALACLLAMSVLPGFGDSPTGTERGAGVLVELPDGTTAVSSLVDGSAVVSHRLAGAVVGAAGVVLLAAVAQRVAGDRAGLLAGLLATVHPLLWINDGMVLSESLYVPLVALAVLASWHFWDNPTLVNAALVGAAFAVAALTRAEALLLLPFVLPLLAFGRREPLGWRGVLRCTVVGGLVAGAAVAPWVLYNVVRFEGSATMTSQTGAVLSAGSCDAAFHGDAVGYYGANCFDQYVAQGWEEWPDPQTEESLRDVPAREGAIRYLGENIEELPRVMVFRVGRMWEVYRPGQNTVLNYQVEGRGRMASWSGLTLFVLLLVPAGVGLGEVRRRGLPISPLLGQALVVTVTAAFTFGVTRYRVPADAAMVVAAGVGLDAMMRWRPRATSEEA